MPLLERVRVEVYVPDLLPVNPIMEELQNTPLILADNGTIRVKGSRVTLDVIVREFKRGATAE